MPMTDYLIWFDKVGMGDIERVGGKNASLGQMISQLGPLGVHVPNGFATTAEAYRHFLSKNQLDKKIFDLLDSFDIDNITALTKAGRQIRQWIMDTPFPPELESALCEAYQTLEKQYGAESSFAVRSSATAEDLPDASFAGQQETYLNIKGEAYVLASVKAVFASLFNDRAISYRVHQNFEHRDVALSAGVQHMIRSDIGASGVMFTLDTESGFQDVVFITAAYGLGETVVQGSVNPDEFYVHKPMLKADKHAVIRRNLGSKAIKMIYGDQQSHDKSTLTVEVPINEQRQFCLNDEEIMQLARQAITIEEHYGRPMDIEWAKDGNDGKLYIVQARPETVKSHDAQNVLQRYNLKSRGEVILTGRSIGQRIGAGVAKVLKDISEMDRVQAGDVLITDMTDPDWEPVMKRAAAIITNRGGRTCHAAIIARELGIPAVVGTSEATTLIKDGQEITVSCAEGETGFIYEGIQEFSIDEINLQTMPDLPFKIMLNVGTPDRAFDFQFLPNAGIGLARLEFIINRMIGIHPKALIFYDHQPDDIKQQIDERIAGYADPVSFYIEKLTEGIATLAAAFWPKQVIVRLSDFKSNEYANMLGGRQYEPHEENPMIGFRGASRYVDLNFQACFELECFALKKVRDEMGFTNVAVMVPFVRTPHEAHDVINLLHDNELTRGVNGLKIYMMCEIPSNALLAEQFLKYFDGFSIGSNDLTQLTLGLDRDSELVAELFDERNEAVKKLLSMAIQACRKQGKYIGICGQGPSDYPDFARWLMLEGIDSVSLNPDSVIDTWLYLAKENQN